MKNLLMLKIAKIYLILNLLFLISFSHLKAEIFNEIKIIGNQRLSVETVLMFSGLKSGIDLSDEDLNNAFKNLYKTDYFKDIEFVKTNMTLEIKISENPIIQSILINGIKNKSMIKNLGEITKKSEKYPFLIFKIEDQKNQLLNIVRSNGFYFAELETAIVDNKNNWKQMPYNI